MNTPLHHPQVKRYDQRGAGLHQGGGRRQHPHAGAQDLQGHGLESGKA